MRPAPLTGTTGTSVLIACNGIVAGPRAILYGGSSTYIIDLPSEHLMTTAADPFPQPIRSDVLIVGAGPVGLFAAFEAGVIGLSCQIVDALDKVGGQCTELYPDKPIYDIPAIPSCTARELVERLLVQCKPFDVPIHLEQRVESVEQRDDGRWTVHTDRGLVFDVAAILLAAGNGAFVPQKLALAEAVPLESRHVHYSVQRLADFAGKTVVVAGGGDSALDWALALREVARRVTLVHRRNGFSAANSSVDAMRWAVEAGEMDFVVGAIAGLNVENDALRSIALRHIEGETQLDAERLRLADERWVGQRAGGTFGLIAARLDLCDAEVPALWPLISTAAESEVEIVPGDGLLDVRPGPPRRVGLTTWSPDGSELVVVAAAEVEPGPDGTAGGGYGAGDGEGDDGEGDDDDEGVEALQQGHHADDGDLVPGVVEQPGRLARAEVGVVEARHRAVGGRRARAVGHATHPPARTASPSRAVSRSAWCWRT